MHRKTLRRVGIFYGALYRLMRQTTNAWRTSSYCPAFIAWLVLAATTLVVIRANRRFSHAYAYAWRFALGSTIGFVVANAFLMCATLHCQVAIRELERRDLP
jgi:hypothetical protein